MPLIECQGVSCRLGGQVVLRDVSFSVAEGSWAWLLGQTGSGKTTLLRVLAGLEALDAGTVGIDGQLASNHEVTLVPHRRAIGLMFQEPSLWPHLDALANVALGLPRGVKSRGRKAAAREWLERLGAAESAGRFPDQLSGGEARRVTLARALAARPRILLLDEPTAHIDIHLREGLMRQVRHLHEGLALTTLCVTHQIEPPMQLSDRVLLLEDGQLRFAGPLGELAGASGSPYVEVLRRSIDRLGP